MSTKYLIPHQFKKIGWCILLLGIVLGIHFIAFNTNFDILKFEVFSINFTKEFISFEKNNIYDELISVLVIVGALLVAFSKEKTEDEYLIKIRLISLVKATIVNYVILLFAIMSVYDFDFYWILVFNMFTTLILYIVLFNTSLLKIKKDLYYEE
jgi:hypothetical protein